MIPRHLQPENDHGWPFSQLHQKLSIIGFTKTGLTAGLLYWIVYNCTCVNDIISIHEEKIFFFAFQLANSYLSIHSAVTKQHSLATVLPIVTTIELLGLFLTSPDLYDRGENYNHHEI